MPDAPFARMLVTALGIAACAFGAASFAHARGASDDASLTVTLGVMAALGAAFLRGYRELETRGVFVPMPPVGTRSRLALVTIFALVMAILITHASFAMSGNRVAEVGLGVVLGSFIALATQPKLVAIQPFTIDMQPPRTLGYMQIVNAAIQGSLALQFLSFRHLYFPIEENWLFAAQFCTVPVFAIYGALLIRRGTRETASS